MEGIESKMLTRVYSMKVGYGKWEDTEHEVSIGSARYGMVKDMNNGRRQVIWKQIIQIMFCRFNLTFESHSTVPCLVR